MKSTEMSGGMKSESRPDFSSAAATGGISNVSQADNSPVMMNKPEMADRGSRADELVEMAGDDSYRLGTEAPRMSKIKG